jgi:hypothetical protein
MPWLLTLLAFLPGTLPGQGTRPARVLFVGNSYTYFNDLPLMVRALADSAGLHGLIVDAVTAPGAALKDLWAEGSARARIRALGADIVVMQQGPSSQPEGREWLLEGVDSFAVEIRRAGGRPALYMVWPSRGRSQDFDGTRESYTMAASRSDGILFPAGEAWRAAWRRDPALELYGPDDLHPTPLGSYLVALVIAAELSGRSPRDLPSTISVGQERSYTLTVPGPVATTLKDAAAEAIQRYGRH